MLSKIEIPRVLELEPVYGRGKEIAMDIIYGKRFTMEELLPHMVEEGR